METLLDDRLRWYHKIFIVVFIPLCIVIACWYGWIGYATLSERPGINGDWYYYYQLSRRQFYLYNFVVALVAFTLGLLQLIYLVTQDKKRLTKTFWALLLFIVLVVLAEVYLESRRIPKG